jgi:hypothetical protein
MQRFFEHKRSINFGLIVFIMPSSIEAIPTIGNAIKCRQTLVNYFPLIFSTP